MSLPFALAVANGRWTLEPGIKVPTSPNHAIHANPCRKTDTDGTMLYLYPSNEKVDMYCFINSATAYGMQSGCQSREGK
ncbi:hypothetical protein AcW1_005362 [Taiwanofungus camphoratus]|nr:hypothetical protein AcW2_004130 [Antrodia cinnamomea]KAI0933559.1 hypothetical protein AcV5_005678 [Antrodia cinnamomea]KAI0956753.1 hypothetical protein AcW1_005362 [Antrodia cinnamomea]